MSLQMFFEYCQTSSVDYIVRESVPHGRRRDGESATADDRSCPRDDQPPITVVLIDLYYADAFCHSVTIKRIR